MLYMVSSRLIYLPFRLLTHFRSVHIYYSSKKFLHSAVWLCRSLPLATRNYKSPKLFLACSLPMIRWGKGSSLISKLLGHDSKPNIWSLNIQQPLCHIRRVSNARSTRTHVASREQFIFQVVLISPRGGIEGRKKAQRGGSLSSPCSRKVSEKVVTSSSERTEISWDARWGGDAV